MILTRTVIVFASRLIKPEALASRGSSVSRRLGVFALCCLLICASSCQQFRRFIGAELKEQEGQATSITQTASESGRKQTRKGPKETTAKPYINTGLSSETQARPTKGRQGSYRRYETDILALTAMPRSLFVTEAEGVISEYDRTSLKRRGSRVLPERLETVAFGSDDQMMAYSSGSIVHLYDLESGAVVKTLKKLSSKVTTLAFSPDSASVLIGGADGRVYRWRPDVKDPSGFERYSGHSSIVSAIAPHPAGRVFFSGDWNGRISAWLPYDADVHGGKYDENLFGPRVFADRSVRVAEGVADGKGIEHLRVTSDGHYLIVSTATGSVELWKIRGFKRVGSYKAHEGLIYDVGIDGDNIVTIGRDGVLQHLIINREKMVDMLEPLSRHEVGQGRRLTVLGKLAVIVSHDGQLSSIPF